MVMSAIIGYPEERYDLQWQESAFAGTVWFMIPGKAGEWVEARDALAQSGVKDESQHYIPYAMSSKLHKLVEKILLYSLEDKELID